MRHPLLLPFGRNHGVFYAAGRLMSLLMLTHFAVSPLPLLPQESAYISSAKVTRCSYFQLITIVMSQPLRLSRNPTFLLGIINRNSERRRLQRRASHHETTASCLDGCRFNALLAEEETGTFPLKTPQGVFPAGG